MARRPRKPLPEFEFEIGAVAHRVAITFGGPHVEPAMYELTEPDAVSFAKDLILAIRDLRELGGTHADLESLIRSLERI